MRGIHLHPVISTGESSGPLFRIPILFRFAFGLSDVSGNGPQVNRREHEVRELTSAGFVLLGCLHCGYPDLYHGIMVVRREE